MTAIDYLLILPIIVLIFSAYEIGALNTKRWHTISYYASRNKYLAWTITLTIWASGISLGVWSGFHFKGFIPQ